MGYLTKLSAYQYFIRSKFPKEKPECEKMQKSWVCPYWQGCNDSDIHRRYPTTAQRGDFCLLSFLPGPIHLSLSNLVDCPSEQSTILTPCLARTSDQHITVTTELPASGHSELPWLPRSWITGAHHYTQPIISWRLNSYCLKIHCWNVWQKNVKNAWNQRLIEFL